MKARFGHSGPVAVASVDCMKRSHICEDISEQLSTEHSPREDQFLSLRIHTLIQNLVSCLESFVMSELVFMKG